VRPFTTLHPRCGTNFLMIVMLISIFAFAFLGWPNLLERILSRVILMPVIAGVSYELIRYAGKNIDHPWVKAAIWPGLCLQKLTTREPDDSQIEVAIASLKAVLPPDDKAVAMAVPDSAAHQRGSWMHRKQATLQEKEEAAAACAPTGVKMLAISKLRALEDKYLDLEAKISDPEVIANQPLWQQYTKEHAKLEEVVAAFREYRDKQQAFDEAEAILKDGSDPDLTDLAREEIKELKPELEGFEKRLTILLLAQGS
jgi:hypothetical protein